MDEHKIGSAYRAFRVCAYRQKYDTALWFGSSSFTFGELLDRAEYAYNSFRQMGVEEGERVCLWLPHCPDLLAAFYGLSRLGAVPVLLHPECSVREAQNLLNWANSKVLITTPCRYDRFCKNASFLPKGHFILCRPERDLKGREKAAYLEALPKNFSVEGYYFDQLMAENRYNANETPACAPQGEAVVLFGNSCFLQCKPISYTAEELAHTAEVFARHRESVSTVFIENSFATEGGFLAAHSALSSGRTILWRVGEVLPYLLKRKPDYLVATEEVYWVLRQNALLFKGRWGNLAGGIQIGKELTPIMMKFAGRAFAQMGGKGTLDGTPVPLKVRKEELYFVEDVGVRLSDMEAFLCTLSGLEACRCSGEGSGIRLRLQPAVGVDASSLSRRVLACCREEMNRFHLPEKLEFGIV